MKASMLLTAVVVASGVVISLAGPSAAVEPLNTPIVWLKNDSSQYAFCEATNVSDKPIASVTVTLTDRSGPVEDTATCAPLLPGAHCFAVGVPGTGGTRCTIEGAKAKSVRAGIVKCEDDFPSECKQELAAY